MSILLNLYQSMANAHVLAKHSDTPLEELPWTELCALLHENVETLILNFHKARERVSVPKHQLPLLSSVTLVHTAVSLKRSDSHAPKRIWTLKNEHL